MAFKMKGFSGFGNSPVKQVRRNITRPTRGEVISAFVNPFDVKNKIKTIKHYGPKIKKFLNTPVKKRK